MICQKCKYPYANTLGCGSCGWKYDPNYHPDLGSGPEQMAEWVLSQSQETLERLYGANEAAAKIAAAKAHAKPEPPPPSSAQVPPKASVVTAKPAAAVKPDFSAPAVTETVAEKVDERILPKEQPAPTGT